MSQYGGYDKQMERKLNGLCWRCGDSCAHGSILCDMHLRYERLRKRKATGSKHWLTGGDGRPPKEFKKPI